jgi:hypothetical protein
VAESMPAGWAKGWQFDAACRGEDSALFFAPGYFERREEKAAREFRAKTSVLDARTGHVSRVALVPSSTGSGGHLTAERASAPPAAILRPGRSGSSRRPLQHRASRMKGWFA